jgi:Mn-dependent DtxR family transcriptional regulator
MTQELIANMLGVRREGVTEAAGHLQTAGLIHYSRGHITILDRPKLEKRVCECYAVVKKETDRLMLVDLASLANKITHAEHAARHHSDRHAWSDHIGMGSYRSLRHG